MNYEFERLFEINVELENSDFKKEDFETALNELYESFDGYLGIRTEMDDWNIDKDGLKIPHSFKETEDFYYKMREKIYNMLIENEYCKINDYKKTEYEKGFAVGRRKAFYEIKEYINGEIK